MVECQALFEEGSFNMVVDDADRQIHEVHPLPTFAKGPAQTTVVNLRLKFFPKLSVSGWVRMSQPYSQNVVDESPIELQDGCIRP